MKKGKALIGVAAAAGIAGIAYVLWPKKKVPASAIVDPFDKEKYLGKWNEVARLPNLIEKDLRDLTEEYSLNEDGTIKVVTRAFNPVKNKAVEATGTIKFKGAETRGQLEVAYFLPIYLDYNILDIDDNYQYALVSGSSMSYLWLLSRESSMPEEMKQRFLQKAMALGFEISKLEWMDY
ncbi:lipocalin [Mucilaginibacter rubeus]|uniref:Lipocalin n=1 Tax=Mucilaginibacter rubeus TaxID=2027860 RepID=A0AAE6JH60_9SPHI|nr:MULTISPECIES: lipocalin family protein [Mucilaginibacter]QEM04980.1 lipocalin [Mucilaginibacter rubeus]QEM17574.1 lipocalin [Mucilaginibacter gossypii]QTE45905.1 lipocalin family protein [Mucilaginibacter rubeus]QTE52502.1 lipocalin family protein [Mucilaginibacter rubeus]QTE57591.1 lipocalin family protein [Mucilaginibacter rubeus]